MKYNNLKKRIKKNEGFRNAVYLDQLGYQTIGYGHLITKTDNFVLGRKYPIRELTHTFEKDFKKALEGFNNHFRRYNFKKNVNEILIEMIFQLGINGVLTFNRFILALRKKNTYMAALEMMDSIWYKQTERRADTLISRLLEVNEKKRK